MPVIDRPLVTPNTAHTTNAPPTTTTTTTAPNVVDDPAATGLQAGTDANPAPSAGGALPLGALAGAARVIPSLLQPPSGPSKLALLPGYPQCVGLPQVLAQAAQSPQFDRALTQVFAAFEKETGVAVPPAMQAVVRAHPERIAEAFVVTPQQMRAGFDALNAAARSGKLKPTAPKSRQLAQHVTIGKIDLATIKRGDPALQEVAPGLFHGDVKNSAVPDDQAKQNIVTAEIFDRLAGNALSSAKDDFKVTYGGKTYSTVGGFLEALQKSGHKIEARIDYRAADFAAMKVKNPQAPDGVVDVPAAVLVATGIKDASGREAILPAIHGELIFHIEGADVNADLKWYQGVPDTGFFPCDVNRRSTWLGRTTTCSFSGADAIKAARLAATHGDVVNTVADKDGLYMNGYGETGVCLDSVCIIEQALTGACSGFPLFMKDDIVKGELNARLQDGKHGDHADLKAVKAAVDAVPSDDTAQASARRRIVASLPWTKQNPPLACVQDAMDILGL